MTPTDLIKAVAPIAEAILPPNSTPLEKALLSVELAALAETDAAVIATIWNPGQCPTILLPWLAWALSVDVWDKDWPEKTKRAVIAASPMVHRLKGTRGSVQRALSALGMRTSIDEWWQQSPPARRGTFDVTAFVTTKVYEDGDFLDARLQAQALEATRSSKPKSRAFTFKVGVASFGSFQVASAGEATQLADLGGETHSIGRANGPVGMASAGESVQVFTSQAASRTPNNGVANARVASAATVIQIGYFKGEARIQ